LRSSNLNEHFKSLISRIILYIKLYQWPKDDIRPTLKILKPLTLIQAFHQVRWQEKSNHAVVRKNRMMPRISPPFNNKRPPGNSSLKTPYITRTDMTLKGKRIHKTLYKQMRKLGQCYKHGEKFVPGQQCNKNNLNLMNGVKEGKDFLKVKEVDNKEIMAEEDPMDEYVLSLNALTKSYNHNTIKVKGNYQNKNLIIFIDNGST
jgi:hypothetical protein